ncbi:MAG: transaldolase [Actinomycetota bacterium]|nr:transaldolase [Actinomycetota bacterium]
MTNPTQQLHEAGQSLWLDSISRDLLDSGTLSSYITELSLTGLTSNPTIFEHALANSHDYDEAIRAGMTDDLSGEELFFELALRDLREAADLFAPAHLASDGVDGWVSLEVSPRLSHDAPATLDQAKILHSRADRDDLFIKIPGTVEGAKAIEECIAAGIPVNVTLLFSPEHYQQAAEAYLRGIERRVAAGQDPVVGSVASMFISRWDTEVAERVEPGLQDRLGIAVAGKIYRRYRELLASPRWQRLAAAGARPQRLLWASTSSKSPDASDVLYVSALAAPDTINTMPEKTLLAFADHGQVSSMLPADGGDSEHVLGEFTRAGIDLDELGATLQAEGEQSFNDSWDSLLHRIKDHTRRLAGTR